MLIGVRCSSTLPRVMRLTSIRSSTSRTISASCRSIMARVRAITASEAGVRFSNCNPLLSGASGLRSSCASVARNSFFRASCSPSRATNSSRSSSPRFRCEMSATIPSKLATRLAGPVPSMVVRPLAKTQQSDPSGRRMRYSMAYGAGSSNRVAAATASCTAGRSSGWITA